MRKSLLLVAAPALNAPRDGMLSGKVRKMRGRLVLLRSIRCDFLWLHRLNDALNKSLLRQQARRLPDLPLLYPRRLRLRRLH